MTLDDSTLTTMPMEEQLMQHPKTTDTGLQNKDGTKNNNIRHRDEGISELCKLFQNPPVRGLFIQPLSGIPITFGVKSAKIFDSIKALIWKSGGKVEDPEKVLDSAGHRIDLFDPNSIIRPKNKEIFSFQYILDCVQDNKLKEDLIEYRLNKKLIFEDYNPMDILLGNKRWDSLSKRISLFDQHVQEEECSDIGMLDKI